MIENNIYQTDRILLRRFLPEDIDAIHEMRSDADFMEHLSEPESREQVVSWIEYVSSFWQFNAGVWAVILKETQETIGWCSVWSLLEFPMGEMEIGYAINKRYAGKGFATEVARFAVNYTFQVRKAKRVNAVATPTNFASHRIMEKLGMKQAGQRFLPRYNMEMVYYSISLDEYNPQ